MEAKDKKHVLFAIPKWCDANPAVGFTNDFHNLINPFIQANPSYVVHTVHTDECLMYKQDLNKVIPTYCKTHNISLVIYSLICDMPSFNPSEECYKAVKDTGAKQIIMWPDTGPIWGLHTIDQIKDAVDLHVSLDHPRSGYHDQHPKQPNYISLWTPEDTSLFYHVPFNQKDIPLAFFGSIDKYRDRITFLSTLVESKIKILITGGQRQRSRMTTFQYAEAVRRTKMILNSGLSQTCVFVQAKGRIFETAACGGVIVDFKNDATSDFFLPDTEYIAFTDEKDLVKKMEYYLAHPEEAQAIAMASCNKYYSNFTPFHFWKVVFDYLHIS